MALVACKECKEQISNQAFKCPKCGVRLRRPKRSLFGKLCKLVFIAFNILMAFWIFGGVSHNVSDMNGLNSAEHAGAVIGTGLAVGMLITLWVAGDIILGLFTLLTRPSRD